MTLTSEMSRMAAEFEAAQGERLAAIARIGSEMRRDSRRNKASLARTMSAHHAATKSGLRDIFGLVALSRGAAQDMVELLAKEREDCARDLHRQLEAYVSELRRTVGDEMSRLNASRAKMTRREVNVRRGQMKDLRRRVEALLADSAKLMADLHKDRARAGKLWSQHAHNTPRQRLATVKQAAAPSRRTAPKRKHT